MSKGLDPDQDQLSVGPDLGPNFLQKLSADNTLVDKRVIKLFFNSLLTCRGGGTLVQAFALYLCSKYQNLINWLNYLFISCSIHV